MKTVRFLLSVPAVALLAGCAVGPNPGVVVNPFDWSHYSAAKDSVSNLQVASATPAPHRDLP